MSQADDESSDFLSQQAAYIAYGWPTSGGEPRPADAGGWGGTA
jgi:hypothetical protein